MGQVLVLGVPIGMEVNAQVAEQENRVGLCINTHLCQARKKPHQSAFGLETSLVWDIFGFTNPRAVGSELLWSGGRAPALCIPWSLSLLPCSGWDGEDAAASSSCQALGTAPGGGSFLGSPFHVKPG